MPNKSKSSRIKELRQELSSLGAGYDDGLRARTRQRVVREGLEAARSRRGWLAGAWFMMPRLAAATALALLLLLPALQMRQGDNLNEKSQIRDLSVTTSGDSVVLSWSDGDQPRRVVRATSREELSRMATMPGQTVKGERWVDRHPDDATIVYYLVD